jgi:uncharacterized protein YidB (DUF937 family)
MTMGLLDVVGAMLSGQGEPGAQGGSQAALLQLIIGMLAQGGTSAAHGGGQGGGLAGLVEMFQSAGLSEQVNSWVGTGQNLPISPEQLHGAMGEDQMSQMAARMGLSTGDLSGRMAQMLPEVVDQLTPGGRLPEGGLGDLGGLLGSLMKR